MLLERLKQLSEGQIEQAPQGRLQTRLRERAGGETLAEQINSAFRSEATSTREKLNVDMQEAVERLVEEKVAEIIVRDGVDGSHGEQGPKGLKGQDGKDGTELTGEEIINKINKAKTKIANDKLNIPFSQEGPRRGSGGGGGDIITLSTNGNTITGSFPGTQFTLTRDLKNAVVFARGSRKTLTEDYTKSGLVITFSVSQPAGPITVDGQAL